MSSTARRSILGAAIEPAHPGDRERSYIIRAEPECAQLARDLAKAALVVWDLYSLAGDVELVVGELFANAWWHGCAGREQAEVRLVLGRGDDHVYVGIWDPSPVIPRPTTPDPHALKERGRGLCIVAGFAEAYGFTPHEGGKVAWATFAI